MEKKSCVLPQCFWELLSNFSNTVILFQVLGTPTEENWPGISMSEELQNYHFPYYPAEPLVKRAPRLDSEGIDLVSKFLLYEARKRVSAREAMHHPYFASLGTGVHNLLDGKKGRRLQRELFYRQPISQMDPSKILGFAFPPKIELLFFSKCSPFYFTVKNLIIFSGSGYSKTPSNLIFPMKTWLHKHKIEKSWRISDL